MNNTNDVRSNALFQAPNRGQQEGLPELINAPFQAQGGLVKLQFNAEKNQNYEMQLPQRDRR